MATVTITSAPTLIVGDNTQRQSIIIQNTGSYNVYIGGSNNVSTNDNFIEPYGDLEEDNGGTRMYMGAYYGVTANSASIISYWERNR